MDIDGYDIIRAQTMSDVVSPNATPVISAIADALDSHGIVVVDASDARKEYRQVLGRMGESRNMRREGYFASLESSVETAANSLPRVPKFKRMSVAKGMSEAMAYDDDVLAMLKSGVRPYSNVSCDYYSQTMCDVSDFIGDESNGNAGCMTRCACGVLLVENADDILSDTIKQLRNIIAQGRVTTSDGRVRLLPAVTVFACGMRQSAENIAKDLGVELTEYAEFDIERAIEAGAE